MIRLVIRQLTSVIYMVCSFSGICISDEHVFESGLVHLLYCENIYSNSDIFYICRSEYGPWFTTYRGIDISPKEILSPRIYPSVLCAQSCQASFLGLHNRNKTHIASVLVQLPDKCAT